MFGGTSAVIAAPVPEPSTIVLLLVGFGVVVCRIRIYETRRFQD
ncbi:PEP-CTERM sorting domain-containing protein [Methyloversatilis sp.]